MRACVRGYLGVLLTEGAAAVGQQTQEDALLAAQLVAVAVPQTLLQHPQTPLTLLLMLGGERDREREREREIWGEKKERKR